MIRVRSSIRSEFNQHGQARIKVAIERYRDMGSPEGWHDLEPGLDQAVDSQHDEDRESFELILGQVVDLILGSCVVRGEAPSLPDGESSTECFGLASCGVRVEVVAADDENRIIGYRCPTYSRFGIGRRHGIILPPIRNDRAD